MVTRERVKGQDWSRHRLRRGWPIPRPLRLLRMLILPCQASQSFDLEPFALKSNRNPDILRNRKRRKERGSWWASSVGLNQSLLSFGYD